MNDCSVEDDLVLNLLLGDRGMDFTLDKEILGLVVSVVNCVMIDLKKCGLDLESVGAALDN